MLVERHWISTKSSFPFLYCLFQSVKPQHYVYFGNPSKPWNIFSQSTYSPTYTLRYILNIHNAPFKKKIQGHVGFKKTSDINQSHVVIRCLLAP